MMNTHFKVHGKALALANAFGFLFPAEVELIQVIAETLPQGAVAVNIGAGVGTGGLALVEIRPDLDVYTVDISTGGPEGGLQNEINAFKDAGLSPIPRHILGDSHIVHANWRGVSGKELIDFLFIDGDHSAEGLQADMDGWMPLLRPGGYVLFHDYGSPNWGAVQEVVNRYMKHRSTVWKHILTVDTLACYQRVGSK